MNDGELEMEARLAGNLAQMSTIQASPASDSDFICRTGWHWRLRAPKRPIVCRKTDQGVRRLKGRARLSAMVPR
jgi:hypothetical protein